MSKISFLPYPHAYIEEGKTHWREPAKMSDKDIANEMAYIEMILAVKSKNRDGSRIAA